MEKIILGIDPGSQVAGYGVVRSHRHQIDHLGHGSIQLMGATSSGSKPCFEERLLRLGLAMKEILQTYKPHVIVVEKIFLGRNVDSAFKLGHARGVIFYEARGAGVELFEYATRSVKKGVTGSGGAEKDEVRLVLQALLRINRITGLDASDALALACYHAFENQKNILLARAKEL